MFNSIQLKNRLGALLLLSLLACLAFAQDETAAQEAPKMFPPDWWRFWDYNLLRWSFLATTLIASFGLGTLLFSNAMNSNRPARAGCLGWMVFGFAFIGLWLVIFAVLIPLYVQSLPDWVTWLMWGVCILLLIFIILRLTRRS